MSKKKGGCKEGGKKGKKKLNLNILNEILSLFDKLFKRVS